MKNSTESYRLIAHFCLASLATLFSASLLAEEEDLTYSAWLGGADDNDFSAGANWSTDDPPGEDDYAWVNQAGVQSLRLTESVELQGLAMTGAASGETPPTVNLNLGGFVMTLTSTFNNVSNFPNTDGYRPIYLNSTSATGNRSLSITNGTLNVNGIGMQNQSVANTKSILTIGSGATVNLIPGNPASRIGNVGDAEVVVQSGGRLVVGTTGSSETTVGHGAASESVLRVTGATSEIDARQTTVSVGVNGSGRLEVLSGGWYRAAQLDLGTTTSANSNGVLHVAGEGSHVDISNILHVGGISGGSRGAGAVEIFDKATADIGRVRLYENGLLHVHGGTLTLDGESASIWDSGATFRLTLDSVPTAVAVDATVLNLNGVGFELLLGETFAAIPGELVPVLSYSELTGSGIFAGLAEGSLIQATAGTVDYLFSIHYDFEAGNTISLVVVPEPPTVILSLLAPLMALLVYRRRR